MSLPLQIKSTVSLESSYDLHSEESDDADSCLSVGYYRPSSKLHFDTGFLRKSDSSSSLESYSLSRNINLEEALAHLGICHHDMKHEFISSPAIDSRVIFTENYYNDDQAVLPVPDCVSDVSFTPSNARMFVDKSTIKSNTDMDYQCNASGSRDHLSSYMTSVYGNGEAKSVFELDEWSAGNEDLENVHLSIIENFLTTTICPEPKESFNCETCSESDCCNLDFDESSCDSKFAEELSLVGADEDKRLIRISNYQHQENFVKGTKQSIYGNNSPCEREACDMVRIQGFTKEGECDPNKSPRNHTSMETFDDDQVNVNHNLPFADFA